MAYTTSAKNTLKNQFHCSIQKARDDTLIYVIGMAQNIAHFNGICNDFRHIYSFIRNYTGPLRLIELCLRWGRKCVICKNTFCRCKVASVAPQYKGEVLYGCQKEASLLPTVK